MEYLAVIDKPTHNACFRTQAVITVDEYVVSEKFLYKNVSIDFNEDLLTLCGIDAETYKEIMEWVLSDVQAMLEYLEWMTEEGINFVELLPEIVEFNANIEEYLMSKKLSPNYLNVKFNKILL